MDIAPENVFVAVEPHPSGAILFVTRGAARTPSPATPEETEAIIRQCPHVANMIRLVEWRDGAPAEPQRMPSAERVAAMTAARVSDTKTKKGKATR